MRLLISSLISTNPKVMDKFNQKNSANLLIEICKQINMRKYIKRQIMDTRIKMMSLPKFRQTKIKVSSLLAPEEILVTDEIKELRKTLYKIARRILNKNTLTVENIRAEEFELSSTNLMEGYCEMLSADGKKTYVFLISNAEILEYTTKLDQKKANPQIWEVEAVSDLHDYIQFMNLPPF